MKKRESNLIHNPSCENCYKNCQWRGKTVDKDRANAKAELYKCNPWKR